MHRRRSHPAGFTLLELVLVMVLIGVAMAMAAPSLSGWSRGGKLRDAGDQFLAVTRHARSQAVADARVYRLNVDPASNTYWLTMQDGQNFVDLGSNFGRRFTLPEGFRIQLQDAQASPQALPACDFFPTGRTQPAQVRISNEQGNVLDISCATPAEGFALGSLQEPTR
ncbi:MAG TPA: GspH/FimT family pseudopilin [Tepidisphaeraceae bacterium]|nr:GspH/FimT family pseudopilin [Tepidisphaeraceae bacterium]